MAETTRVFAMKRNKMLIEAEEEAQTAGLGSKSV